MPDFFARLHPSDCTLETWQDPATSTQPSRINPRASVPIKVWHVAVGASIRIQATVPGLGLTPLDTALGGRLFYAACEEAPVPHAVTGTAGKSSEQTIVPQVAGHYVVSIRRPSGGGVLLHFEAL